MAPHELSGTTALVTGGVSRGFDRGMATALAKASANVVGVARDRALLEELHAELGDTFTPVAADAADPVVAGQLTDEYEPRTLVTIVDLTIVNVSLPAIGRILTLDGLTEHHSDRAAVSGLDQALTGPAAASAWAQATGLVDCDLQRIRGGAK